MTRAQNDAYFTPLEVAEACLQRLVLNNQSARMLEPSVGGYSWVRAAETVYRGKLRSIACVDVERRTIPPSVPWSCPISFSEKDFLDWTPPHMFDLILGNPPFSQIDPKGKRHSVAEKHVRRALAMLAPGGLCGMLLRLGFLASSERVSLWRQYPPDAVRVLVNRPSFTGPAVNHRKGQSDSHEYAFFVWRRPWENVRFDGSRRLEWIDWKGSNKS